MILMGYHHSHSDLAKIMAMLLVFSTLSNGIARIRGMNKSVKVRGVINKAVTIYLVVVLYFLQQISLNVRNILRWKNIHHIPEMLTVNFADAHI
jgi:hypothetical protein